MKEEDLTDFDFIKEKVTLLKEEIGKVIIGQDEAVTFVLMSIFTDGHSLLIGVPGLAKTLLINTIAKALDINFKRIQFTPDLMPSDILGTEIIDGNKEFKYIKGPIFSNIVLADEINRTPPKTQSALLEALQEKQVTIAGKIYDIEEPFCVLATQNPIEQEGTYPLPEAQVDRFMFSIILTYPSFEEEVQIVKNDSEKVKVNKVFDKELISKLKNTVNKIPVSDNVIEYTIRLVSNTRPSSKNKIDIVNEYFEWGAGPRASQKIIIAAKCYAMLQGKYSPDIEDVQKVAVQVLRHRIVLNYKAGVDNLTADQLITRLL